MVSGEALQSQFSRGVGGIHLGIQIIERRFILIDASLENSGVNLSQQIPLFHGTTQLDIDPLEYAGNLGPDVHILLCLKYARCRNGILQSATDNRAGDIIHGHGNALPLPEGNKSHEKERPGQPAQYGGSGSIHKREKG